MRQVKNNELFREVLETIPNKYYRVAGSVALFCDNMITRVTRDLDLDTSPEYFPLLLQEIKSNPKVKGVELLDKIPGEGFGLFRYILTMTCGNKVALDVFSLHGNQFSKLPVKVVDFRCDEPFQVPIVKCKHVALVKARAAMQSTLKAEKHLPDIVEFLKNS